MCVCVCVCVCVISTEVVYLQCCLLVTLLVPHENAAVLAHVLCTPHNHPSVSVSLYLKPNTQRAGGLSCNLPPALLAEWPGSFMHYCSNTGVKQTPKQESTQKVDPGEVNPPPLLLVIQPTTFQSGALTLRCPCSPPHTLKLQCLKKSPDSCRLYMHTQAQLLQQQ